MSTILHGQDAIIAQPDAMTYGMAAYTSLSPNNVHPVDNIQKVHFKRVQQIKDKMARDIYGSHFVDGLRYEQESIAKLHATGFNPSLHSLEISRNTHTTITNEDYMSLPKHQPQMPRVTTHQTMQRQHDLIGM